MSICALGFDVGTLTSHIAVARTGGVEMIANDFSDRATPTCVAFTGNIRSIGTSGKMQQVMNLKNTFVNFTRLVGKKLSDPFVQKEMSYIPYKIFEDSNNHICMEATHHGEKITITPEQLVAMQLTKLRELAEAEIKAQVTDIVLSVPTYYTDAERRALLDASSIAGLKCVKLVNDMTAAATAHGFYSTGLPTADNPPKIIAFVSVGYANSQVFICAYHSNKMKVMAAAYDAFLGGRDFDQIIFNKCTAEFNAKYKLNIVTSPKATIRTLQECEKLKKAMGLNSSTLPLNIECLMDERDLHISMNRAEFENLSSELVDRFEKLLTNCLTLAKLTPESIHSVEIIGGSCRIPILKNVISSVFKKECRTSLNSDEAVARGCAFQAAICSPAFKVKEFSVTDVCLYPIIVRTDGEDACLAIEPNETDDSVTTGSRDSCIEVFPLFHPIPSSRQIVLTRRSPLVLLAKYADSASLPNQNTAIGVFTVGNTTTGDDSRKIRLKLRINAHGIFNISQAQLMEEYEKEVEVESPEQQPDGQNSHAPDKSNLNGDAPKENDQTNCDSHLPDPATKVEKPVQSEKKLVKKKFVKYHDLSIDVKNMQFDYEKLTSFHELEANLIQQDRLERERINAKNAVEEYVYEMRSKLQGEYNPYVTSAEMEELLKMLDDTANWLYDEGEDVKRQLYEERLGLIKSKGDPFEFRASEHINRPAAIQRLTESIMNIKGVLQHIDAFSHLTEEQVNQLKNSVMQSENWLNHSMQQQNLRPQTTDPIVKVADIISQIQTLESICHPIINTPKPAPPTQNAENKTATDGSCDTNGQQSEPATTTGKEKNQGEKEENMDLD